MAATEDNGVDSELIDKARDFLAGVLERMGMDADIDVSEEDDKFVFDIQCDNVERIIGRRGQVVDALQHLVGKVLAKHRGATRTKPIIVDAGGYRDKHIERLQGLAERMRDKALESGDEVALNPMTPHDRRIVHLHLADLGDVTTRSEGEGEDRHVIVVPSEPVEAAAPAE